MGGLWCLQCHSSLLADVSNMPCNDWDQLLDGISIDVDLGQEGSSKMKLYGVWCEPKDGRRNSHWIGGKDKGMGQRLFSHQNDAHEVYERVRKTFPNWTFEVREYQGDEQ